MELDQIQALETAIRNVLPDLNLRVSHLGLHPVNTEQKLFEIGSNEVVTAPGPRKCYLTLELIGRPSGDVADFGYTAPPAPAKSELYTPQPRALTIQ